MHCFTVTASAKLADSQKSATKAATNAHIGWLDHDCTDPDGARYRDQSRVISDIRHGVPSRGRREERQRTEAAEENDI